MMDGQLDGQVDGLTLDESDFIGCCSTNLKHPNNNI